MDSPSLKLVIVQGPREGEAVEFRFGSTIKIGRVVRGNNLPIKDAGISTQHLVIESLPESNRWALTDLDSSNGTILNSVKLAPHAPTGLNNGDVLKLGESTSIMVKIVSVVEEEECLGSMPRRNPRRGAVKAKNPRVEVEVAKLDDKPPRNPTRRGKGKNTVVEVENVEVNKASELERVDTGENPSQHVGTYDLEESSLQLNPKKQVSTNNVKIKVELESKEMPENNKSPEVEVKRPRGRPPRNGAVVERVARSRSRVNEVESMDLEKGKEVMQKKTRDGATGRGRGRVRRGNSKNVSLVDEVVEVVKSSQIQIVENKEDDNSGRNVGVGEEGGERGNEEQGSGEEPRNGSHKEKKDENIEVIREGDSKEKDNDNVEVVGHSDSEKRKNDNVEVVRHSDSEKSKNDNDNVEVVRRSDSGKRKNNDSVVIGDSDSKKKKKNDHGVVIGDSDSKKRKNGDCLVIGDNDSKKKEDDNDVVNQDRDIENKENDYVIITDSDEEELAAGEKRADGGSHGKTEAGNGLDWGRITVGEWLDHLEVILPKQIRGEMEKMIDEMRTKAERVKNYMIEQKTKAKEIAKCS